ncbi:MAG TPA: zf-HC2 domain-containing protein [Pseudonocardiaceae bacterium]|jgi:hypothetical protein|nr:zf-HC2 domain-containing protein [Pseudonocardiaceae bacterium]
MTHASQDLITRYAQGGELPADAVWALESHLESCAACRALLSEAAEPSVTDLVAKVAMNLDELLDKESVASRADLGPGTERARGAAAARLTSGEARRRWWPGLRAGRSQPDASGALRPGARRWWPEPGTRLRVMAWAGPAMVPWLGMTVLLTAVSVALDWLATGLPSVMLLLSPVLPVGVVAASWSAGLDPASELVAAAARSGLSLVLRRTVVALLALAPVLAVGGWLSGTHPVEWVVPGLAFALGTLALGTVIGVGRAAGALAAAWGLLVVAPGLSTQRIPVVLQPVGLPYWAIAIGVCAAVVALRRGVFARLGSQR